MKKILTIEIEVEDVMIYHSEELLKVLLSKYVLRAIRRIENKLDVGIQVKIIAA